MGESGVGGTSANWNMLGTTSKRDKELWEEKRKQYAEARARGEDPSAKAREEYERWYREEREPTWQEKLVDKITGRKRKEGKKTQEDEGTEVKKDGDSKNHE